MSHFSAAARTKETDDLIQILKGWDHFKFPSLFLAFCDFSCSMEMGESTEKESTFTLSHTKLQKEMQLPRENLAENIKLSLRAKAKTIPDVVV